MSILITGAAGFIGNALLRRLAATGDEPVIGLDRRALAAAPDNVAFHLGDIRDGAALTA